MMTIKKFLANIDVNAYATNLCEAFEQRVQAIGKSAKPIGMFKKVDFPSLEDSLPYSKGQNAGNPLQFIEGGLCGPTAPKPLDFYVVKKTGCSSKDESEETQFDAGSLDAGTSLKAHVVEITARYGFNGHFKIEK